MINHDKVVDPGCANVIPAADVAAIAGIIDNEPAGASSVSECVVVLNNGDTAPARTIGALVIREPHLSPREREVVDMVIAGLTDCEIATRLGIGIGTLGTYFRNLRKYGMPSKRDRLALIQALTEYVDSPSL